MTDCKRRPGDAERGDSPSAGGPDVGRGAHRVEPELVAETGFTGWTRGGRLRHPRFIGLPDYRRAADVVRGTPG